MQTVIRLNGHVSWDGQMNGLPKTIYAYMIYLGDDTKGINDLIEAQSGAFIRSQAMFVQKDQGQIIDIRQTPAERMLVPLKWIVSIDADVIPITGELSTPDENGVERLIDGSEPVKQ
jgi:hypothetical protein